VAAPAAVPAGALATADDRSAKGWRRATVTVPTRVLMAKPTGALATVM
jgi:hypothetical protein